jgi:hypothetical protein
VKRGRSIEVCPLKNTSAERLKLLGVYYPKKTSKTIKSITKGGANMGLKQASSCARGCD